MSVSIYSRSHDEALRAVRYHAAYVDHYGPQDRYALPVPALVWVDFSQGSLALEIGDARALMEGLAVALVEHAVAVRDASSGPQAVA